MATPYIGEIRMFAGNFAPNGWTFCDGQLLSISSFSALFSLLGTTYGGDGQVTFGLPDLRGRVPIHQGNGPGLTTRQWGSNGGLEQVTLNANQLPSHTHGLSGDSQNADSDNPDGNYLATDGSYKTSGDLTKMNAQTVSNAGTQSPNLQHNNLQPFQCINHIIALTGLFPSEN